MRTLLPDELLHPYSLALLSCMHLADVMIDLDLADIIIHLHLACVTSNVTVDLFDRVEWAVEIRRLRDHERSHSAILHVSLCSHCGSRCYTPGSLSGRPSLLVVLIPLPICIPLFRERLPPCVVFRCLCRSLDALSCGTCWLGCVVTDVLGSIIVNGLVAIALG